MASKKIYLIGLITILLFSSGTAYFIYNSDFGDVKFRIDKDSTKIYYLDNGRWRIGGEEINSLWSGTSKLNRKLSELKLIDVIGKNNESWTRYRITNYKNNMQIIDEYFFDGSINNIELVPRYHKITILNASNFIYQYEVKKLGYQGETKFLKGIYSMSFNHNIKVEWSKGNYYSKIYKYKGKDEGKLIIRYKITSDNVTFYNRLFDPTTFSINLTSPDNQTITADTTPDFNFTVSGTESSYSCELFIDDTGYGKADFTNVGHIDNGGRGYGVWGDGTYIYLANYDGGLRAYTFDGSTFTNTGHIDDGSFGYGVWGDGTYIYLANYDDGLRAYTFDGSTFTNVGHIDNGGYGWSVWGDGTYIYLANEGDGLRAYIFRTPNNTPTTITANQSLSDGTYNWYINCTAGGVTKQSEVREITICFGNTTNSTLYLDEISSDRYYELGTVSELKANLTDLCGNLLTTKEVCLDIDQVGYGDNYICGNGTVEYNLTTNAVKNHLRGEESCKFEENGLILCTKMNNKYSDGENRTLIKDYSGEENNGTFYGESFNDGTINGANWVSGKKGDYALEFDGVDDYVHLGYWQAPFSDKNYTISLWVYIDEFPENNTVNYIFWRNDDAPSMRFNTQGTTLYFSVDGNHNQYIGIDTISSDYIGKWNYLAMSYDGTTEKVYINGELKGEKEVTMEYYLDSRAVILGWDGATNRDLKGKLDSVRIWNRSLNITEIQQEMNSTRPANPNGLVGDWEFEKGEGTTAYDTHNIAKGKYKGGVYFDGVDYIEMSDSNSLDITDEITISAWIKLKVFDKTQTILSKRPSGSSSAYTLIISNDNTIRGNMFGTTDDYVSGTGTPITDNNWHFATITYDGSYIRTFLDGKLDISDDSSGSISTNNNPVSIGRMEGYSDRFFNGTIDSVKIWNRSLTASEINNLYNDEKAEYINLTTNTIENQTFYLNFNKYDDIQSAYIDLTGYENPNYPLNPKIYVNDTLVDSIVGLLGTGNQTLNEFNNSNTAENITFTGSGTKKRYLRLPKNANVTSAYLNISGIYNKNASDCYQESANISTSCGGLATGSYLCDSGGWHNPCSNSFDADWNTFADVVSPATYHYNTKYVYINYTKPTQSSSAKIKYSIYELGNLTKDIPSSCFLKYRDKVRLKLVSSRYSGIYGFVYRGSGIYCYGDSGWVKIDWTGYIWSPTTGDRLYEEGIYWKWGNITNPHIDIADSGGVYEWNYTGFYNISEIADLNATLINEYLSTCSADSEGYCNVPILFYSGSEGNLEISNIEINYTFIIDKTRDLNATVINNYLNSQSNGFHNVPIKISSKTNTTIQVDNINITYFGSDNISVTAHFDGDGTYSASNDTHIIKTVYSRFNHSVEPNYGYLEFTPNSPTSQNILCYGGSDTTPCLNLTFLNYDQNANLSIRINESLNCSTLKVNTENNVSSAHEINTTWYEIDTNKQLFDTTYLWMWMSYNCSSDSQWYWEYPYFEMKGYGVDVVKKG